MKILITGAAGFIGSHLVDALLERDHEVWGLDNLTTGRAENLAEAAEHPRFHFVEGSILERDLIDRLAADAAVIYHLAAAVGVKRILDQPLQSIRTNLLGTHAVLEAANEYGCKVFIASSSEVYGKIGRETGGLLSEEDDRLYGTTMTKRWHYAGTKAIDEFTALAYYEEESLPVVIARFFNTTGSRQTGRYGMVLPTFVRQALNGEPITVYGDGTQTRSFTDVRDAVRAVLLLMETEAAEGDLFNVGSGRVTSINELAEAVKEITGSQSPIIHIPYEEAYGGGYEDMQERTPDIAKLKDVTGYTPSWTLEETIQSVIDYESVHREAERS